MQHKLIYGLVLLSLLFMIIGGASDMKDKKYGVSKHHWWSDGLWILGLAIIIAVVKPTLASARRV